MSRKKQSSSQRHDVHCHGMLGDQHSATSPNDYKDLVHPIKVYIDTIDPGSSSRHINRKGGELTNFWVYAQEAARGVSPISLC